MRYIWVSVNKLSNVSITTQSMCQLMPWVECSRFMLKFEVIFFLYSGTQLFIQYWSAIITNLWDKVISVFLCKTTIISISIILVTCIDQCAGKRAHTLSLGPKTNAISRIALVIVKSSEEPVVTLYPQKTDFSSI